jgi:hypothetical protein
MIDCPGNIDVHNQYINLTSSRAMPSWISLTEACSHLGVRPQTIYAYVSRGKLEVMADPADSRRSLYRAEDVANLAKRKQAGRSHEALATGTLFGAEPSIPTAISTFHHQRLYYRGKDAISLSASASVEEAARLLWQTAQPVDFSWAKSSNSPSRFQPVAPRVRAGVSLPAPIGPAGSPPLPCLPASPRTATPSAAA